MLKTLIATASIALPLIVAGASAQAAPTVTSYWQNQSGVERTIGAGSLDANALYLESATSDMAGSSLGHYQGGATGPKGR